MRIEGQGPFFTTYFPGFLCFVLYLHKISGERLQDHWSSGYDMLGGNLGSLLYGDVSVMGFANDTKKPKVSGVIAFRGHLVEGGLWNKYQGQHGFRHCNIQKKFHQRGTGAL